MALITRECTTLWVHIDFQSFPEGCKDIERFLWRLYAKLTDEMLASFLTKVNAREVTKSLRLWGCEKVRGAGLEPLRHSHILERIDVGSERGTREEMDEALVMDVLRTMIPHKLFHVHFPGWYSYRGMESYYGHDGGKLADRRVKFYRDLKAAKHQQALEQGTICSSCRLLVCDASRQMAIVASKTGLPSLHCSKCLQYYCRTGACPISMKDCSMCGSASCEACNDVRQCTSCNNMYCSECENVATHPCLICHEIYCSNCCDYVTECSMPGCGKSICLACILGGDNIPVTFCEACSESYCIECGKYNDCPECEKSLCFRCSETKTCDLCNETKLSSCDLCFGCHVETCEICKKSVCQSCSEREDKPFSGCDSCFVTFCKDCSPVAPCSCNECGYHFCSHCDDDNYVCTNRPAKRLKRSDSGDSSDSDTQSM